jgi:diguanylate cyclase (GGDEF)-like protein
MAHAERYSHPLSVAMVDIDHFKDVNDTYGHKAGDRVLEGVASILVEHLRMPDKVGRYGGEEFLLVFPETGLDQTQKIAERIRAAVSNAEFDVGERKINLTISIGATLFERGEDLEQLLSRADQALYQAKQSGRNLVVATKVN